MTSTNHLQTAIVVIGLTAGTFLTAGCGTVELLDATNDQHTVAPSTRGEVNALATPLVGAIT